MKLFEKANQQAAVWVKHMMAELATRDSQKALHALRAGLHALRDRLTVQEAAQLSAQLPLLIRGVFFEGWSPRKTPRRIRRRADFLALVRQQSAPRQDFPADLIVAALFRVLARHVTKGELTNVVMSLPEELVDLVEGGWSRGERPLRVR
ncbi:MAG: DUF2267 domain-containing protein [Myxococcales bacterium]